MSSKEAYTGTGAWPWNTVQIYITDFFNSRIARINSLNGSGWTTFGSFGHDVNQFFGPWSIWVGQKGPVLQTGVETRIYVTDTDNHRIVRINNMSGVGWTTLGTKGSGAHQFNRPTGLSLDNQNRIYVADSENARVVRFNDMTGAGWTTFGTKGSGVNQFNDPYGLCLDSAGRIYIADSLNGRIVRFNDMAGTGWMSFGEPGSGVGKFDNIQDVRVSGSKIYAADFFHSRIVSIDDMTGAG